MDSASPKKISGYFPESPSLDQAKDTGMALILVSLLVAVIGRQRAFVGVAIGLLLVDMIWPGFYRPAAKVWFGLSRLLGSFMSKVIFGLIFLVMVAPVGLVRRALGKDALRLRQWKRGRNSVLKTRDHDFASGDIAHPY